MRSEEKSRAKHELFEILSLFSRALIDAILAVVRLMSARLMTMMMMRLSFAGNLFLLLCLLNKCFLLS